MTSFNKLRCICTKPGCHLTKPMITVHGRLLEEQLLSNLELLRRLDLLDSHGAHVPWLWPRIIVVFDSESRKSRPLWCHYLGLLNLCIWIKGITLGFVYLSVAFCALEFSRRSTERQFIWNCILQKQLPYYKARCTSYFEEHDHCTADFTLDDYYFPNSSLILSWLVTSTWKNLNEFGDLQKSQVIEPKGRSRR